MKELINKCKCSISLKINEYRDYYETIEQFVEDTNQGRDEPIIDSEMAQQMIRDNMVIELQFYPDTPIGFYRIFGTSLDEVINEALETFK
jgi:hypothetical protein